VDVPITKVDEFMAQGNEEYRFEGCVDLPPLKDCYGPSSVRMAPSTKGTITNTIGPGTSARTTLNTPYARPRPPPPKPAYGDRSGYGDRGGDRGGYGDRSGYGDRGGYDRGDRGYGDRGDRGYGDRGTSRPKPAQNKPSLDEDFESHFDRLFGASSK
jgi:hypothetical protein